MNRRYLLCFVSFIGFINVVEPVSMITTPYPSIGSSHSSSSRTGDGSTTGFFVNMYVVIVTSSCGVIFNGVLLVVFAADPLRCLRGVTSALIINLSLADLLSSLMILLWSTNIWYWLPNMLVKVVFSGIWLGYTASFLTITLLSCERYIAIRYIWSANRIVTKKRTMYAVATIWLLSCSAFVLMCPKYQNRYIIVLSIVLEISVLVVVVCYLKLWNVRRKQSRQKCPAALKQEIKLTLVVLFLLAILVLTTLPEMTLYQINYFVSMTCGKGCLSRTLQALPVQLLPVFALNFVLNPVIYGWRLPKYRRSFGILCSSVFQSVVIKSGFRLRFANRKVSRPSTVALSNITSASCTSL